MRRKAVVFDMDGVIFDSETLVLSNWKKVALKYGLSDVEVPYRRCLGVNAAETEKIFKDFYGEDFPYRDYKAEVSALYHEAVQKGALAFKTGVKELLEYLKEEGYRIGLASSTRLEVVMCQLKGMEIDRYFDAVIGGDCVEYSKPHPQIYLSACQKLGIRPADAWAVEDSFNGVRSAYHAGMQVIMVPDMMEPDEEMKRLAATVKRNLLQVLEWLKLQQQMDFILEADKEKSIVRQTYISDGSRKENDAEHAWHMALMAYVLAEYSNETVDVARVMAMTLVHDLVEIDAGDTYAYDAAGNATKRDRELAAAERIFGILPSAQGKDIRALWEEFEAGVTPESKFANTLDKIQPLMLNDASGGRSWVEHQVRMQQVLERNARTHEGSEMLWEYAKSLIEKNVEKFSGL